MVKLEFRSLRRWVTLLMLILLVASLATWYSTRDTLPAKIRIATGLPGGMYHQLGEKLADVLHRRIGRSVELWESEGSVANCQALRDKKINVALVQAGSDSLDELSVLAPLYHDVVLVLVKEELLRESPVDGGVASIADLAGKRVIVGEPGSGMRKSADQILRHYDVRDEVLIEEVSFTELIGEDHERYDAAIVATSVDASNLREVLAAGSYDILPLDADALERRYHHFRAFEVPRNLWPPHPTKAISTVATTAMVVVREDASPRLVTAVLDSVHDHSFRHEFPALQQPTTESAMLLGPLHPAASRYYDPFYGFGWLASSVESIAAGRELLVALFAGVFLVWDRWRRRRDQARQARVESQKTRLNEFLERTLRIEKNQMNVNDPETLERLLDQVTEIKLRALDELSREELQDHRVFSIFLLQCANLISKIQLKIILNSRNSL